MFLNKFYSKLIKFNRKNILYYITIIQNEKYDLIHI